MVQPMNYVLPQADPFAGVLQGLKLGATIEGMQAAREQQAMQMDAMRQKAALEQQAAQRAAANEAELQQLQAVPFEEMSRQQQLRLLQLTNSEASRAFIAREIERMPAAMAESRLRRSGSIVNALRMNPEIGIKLLRESADVEQDPQQKKAYETAAGVAEQNPLLAARMIHGMMDFVAASDEKFRRVSDAVANYLERVGSPLYPKEPGKPMIVPPDSTVLQDGVPIFTAPRRSQLLSPEEEAQKARIAAAGRAPREPREPPAPTITQIQDPTEPNRMLTIDARRYQGGGVGSPGVIGMSGKAAPLAAAERKKTEGNAQLQTILDTLQYSYDRLDELRGIPSENRNFMSNAWNWLATTGAGQVAGRMGGTKEQTERDTIQSSRNLLFTAVKNATGKTTGELNSNVEFKTWLDALTDPSRSIQSNRAILENLEKFVASGGNYSTRSQTGKIAPTGARPPAPAPAGGGDVSVTLPDGRTVSFPNQSAADQFRRAAGL